MGKEERKIVCTALLLASWLVPVFSYADNNTIGCQTGTPGIPLERFRTIAGQGTFEMWPQNLRPAETIGQPLPLIRDSTEYTSSPTQLPGAGGLEFFYDLDILEEGNAAYLYMSFNSGFQIWDITGPNATNPQLRSQRNGWFGAFHAFEDPPTEFYLPIWDIDAIDPEGAPGETLVALGGEGPVGPTIWDAANKAGPFQLYQDTSKIAIQVSAANIGGRTYAFFAANNGVHVYDMTRAREIGPCFESTSIATTLCGGNNNPVWRGRLEPWPWGRAKYVDVLETTVAGQPRQFIAVSDGFENNPLGVEIREITDATALPPTSTAIIENLDTKSSGVDLFQIDETYYLGAINRADLEIHEVSACITGGPGCTLSNPKVDLPTGNPNSLPFFSYVQYSESNGRPFLYKGFHSLCSSPSTTTEGDQEFLLELSGLATGDPVVDIRGEEYLDPGHATPHRIDYWSSYYDQATGGFSTFAPHGGLFHGKYFYRGAQTLFDIHAWSEPSAQLQATSADRWLSSGPLDLPEWVDLSGECNGGTDADWQWSAANAPGTPLGDPAPTLEPLGDSFARVRADLCDGDTYPLMACPDRTIEIDAALKCGGLATLAETLDLTLNDPRPFFDVVGVLQAPVEPGPPPLYLTGEELTVQALTNGVNSIDGKSLTTFEWRLVRMADGQEWSCDSGAAAPGLACTATALTWDTSDFDPDPSVIFTDGFESGGILAWGQGASGAVGTFEVTLSVGNDHGAFSRATDLALADR